MFADFLLPDGIGENRILGLRLGFAMRTGEPETIANRTSGSESQKSLLSQLPYASWYKNARADQLVVDAGATPLKTQPWQTVTVLQRQPGVIPRAT